MNTTRKQIVEAAFAEAVEAGAAADGVVDRVCAGDAGVAAEVRQLLELASRDGGLLDRGLTALGLTAHGTDEDVLPQGTRVASYTVVDVLGQGTMGTVYRARQASPAREVAIKVLRSSPASHLTLRRFEFEAEALGRLKHPAVAQVIESGSADTPLGRRAYISMELVEGERLDRFVLRMGTAEKVALMVRVAEGIEHAHQRGVIHRDLKPANILVEGSGQPKILDFGVSTLVSGLPDAQRTMAGQLIGTLAYMSPEQLAATPDAVDTRADVYALGVILHELLAGAPPLDVSGRSIADAARIIQSVAPPRLGSLDRSLRGDLEIIVSKAMEKDRTLRYRSAGELAGDLARYLKHEPIVARRPGAVYLARKLAARHKVATVSAGLAASALVAGLAVSAVAWRRAAFDRDAAVSAKHAEAAAHGEAEKARAQALQQARRSETVAAFLRSLLKSVDPSVAKGKDTVLLRAVLAQAQERVGQALEDQPEAEAELRVLIARTYYNIDAEDEAERAAQAAIDRLESAGLGQTDLAAAALAIMGKAAQMRGNLGDAQRLLERAHEIRSAINGDKALLAATKADLAMVLQLRGRPRDCERLAREAMSALGDGDRGVDPERCRARLALARAVTDLGRPRDAIPVLDEAIAVQTRLSGPSSAEITPYLEARGSARQRAGLYAEAEEDYNQLLSIQQRLLGPTASGTVTAMCNLAVAMQGTGKTAAAAEVYRRAIAAFGPLREQKHFNVGAALLGLGVCLRDLGEYQEADRLLAEAGEIFRASLGEKHPRSAQALGALASSLNVQDRIEEAEPLLRRQLEIERQALPAEHPNLAVTLIACGSTIADSVFRHRDAANARARAEEAVRLLGEGVALTEKTQDGHWTVASARVALGAATVLRDSLMPGGEQGADSVAEVVLPGFKRLEAAAPSIPSAQRGRVLYRAANRVANAYAAAGALSEAAVWRARAEVFLAGPGSTVKGGTPN